MCEGFELDARDPPEVCLCDDLELRPLIRRAAGKDRQVELLGQSDFTAGFERDLRWVQ